MLDLFRLDEAISSSWDRLKIGWVGRIGFDLRPEAADELSQAIISDAFFVDLILRPDCAYQGIFLANRPFIVQKVGEEVKLLCGEGS